MIASISTSIRGVFDELLWEFPETSDSTATSIRGVFDEIIWEFPETSLFDLEFEFFGTKTVKRIVYKLTSCFDREYVHDNSNYLWITAYRLEVLFLNSRSPFRKLLYAQIFWILNLATNHSESISLKSRKVWTWVSLFVLRRWKITKLWVLKIRRCPQDEYTEGRLFC